MSSAIEFENISKQYRLGLVSTGTIAHDLNRWWTMNILRREDPYLKIGETNDRSRKGHSDYVWALKDINFKVEQGDVVGIIGKNGAGKSTLLKLLSRVTTPTTGQIRVRGRIASLLEVGTGFHPEMTGRENIFMNGAIMGMTKHEISRKLDEIIDFSGCERYIDTPVKRYSSGMTVRLGFAIAAHLDPEILVVDEVLAVGDAEFQKKAIGKMQDVAHGQGRTVLFVSHNMASIKKLCHTGVLLCNGQVSFLGKTEDCISMYVNSNDYSENRVFDINKDVVYYSKTFRLKDVKINNKTPDVVVIDQGNNSILIDIEAECQLEFNVEFIVRLLDKNDILIASYNSSNVNGRIYHTKNGNIFISELIYIPDALTNGEYKLQVHLTQRNINYLAQIPLLAKVIKKNFISPHTFGLYSNLGTGYFVLNGESLNND